MIEWVLAASLLLRDPPGDAIGAGDLIPPSAEQYRNLGSFDLLEIGVPDATMLSVTVEMGALPNPAGLANGFSNPVIDVYLDLGEGGAEASLPGPDVRMPPGRGWEVAIRITGDGAAAHRAIDSEGGGPAVSYPVRVSTEDRVITVETPFERGDVQGVYAVTGVYDPFVTSGWRPLADAPSPWAFASAEQRRPVVDVLAADSVAQAEAIRSGVLPRPRNRAAGAMWVLLMVLGVVVAGVGLVLRRMVPPRGARPATALQPTPGAAAGPASAGSGTASEGAAVAAAASAPSADPVALPEFLPALPPPSDEVPSPPCAPERARGASAPASQADSAPAAEGLPPSADDRREATGEEGSPKAPTREVGAAASQRPGGWPPRNAFDADGSWRGADGFETFANLRIGGDRDSESDPSVHGAEDRTGSGDGESGRGDVGGDRGHPMEDSDALADDLARNRASDEAEDEERPG